MTITDAYAIITMKINYGETAADFERGGFTEEQIREQIMEYVFEDIADHLDAGDVAITIEHE